MAGPLPPEAQEVAAGEAPGEAPAEGGGDQQVTQLVKTVSDGLAMLAEISSQAMPQVSQAFQQLNDQYMEIVSGMQGGEAAAPAGQGMASPQQGASGAVPAGPTY